MSGRVKIDPAMLPIRRQPFWDRWGVKIAVAILAISTVAWSYVDYRQREEADRQSLADRKALRARLDRIDAGGARRSAEQRRLVEAFYRMQKDIAWVRKRLERN